MDINGSIVECSMALCQVKSFFLQFVSAEHFCCCLPVSTANVVFLGLLPFLCLSGFSYETFKFIVKVGPKKLQQLGLKKF